MFSRTARLFCTASFLGSTLLASTALAQSIQYTAPAAAPAPSGHGQPLNNSAAPTGYGYQTVIPSYSASPQTLDQQMQNLNTSGTAPLTNQLPLSDAPITTQTVVGPDGVISDANTSYQAPMPVQQMLGTPTPSTTTESFFISGGVGKPERERLEAMKSQYNLSLQMATSGGAFVSEVNVEIKDAKGNVVLSTVTDGPLLMAKLPAGNYTIAASKFGETKTQKVQLAASGNKTVSVFWKNEDI